MHAGMKNKPLCCYDAHSYRSRLPVDECKMPSNNASGIVIGDRSFIFL